MRTPTLCLDCRRRCGSEALSPSKWCDMLCGSCDAKRVVLFRGQGAMKDQLTDSSTLNAWNLCPLNLVQPQHHRLEVVLAHARESIELSVRSRDWDRSSRDRTVGRRKEFRHESLSFHRTPPIYWKTEKEGKVPFHHQFIEENAIKSVTKWHFLINWTRALSISHCLKSLWKALDQLKAQLKNFTRSLSSLAEEGKLSSRFKLRAAFIHDEDEDEESKRKPVRKKKTLNPKESFSCARHNLAC